MTKEERLKQWEEKFQSLTGGISATMVWSHKYGMLITPNKMKEIQKEENKYIERHKKMEEIRWILKS